MNYRWQTRSVLAACLAVVFIHATGGPLSAEPLTEPSAIAALDGGSDDAKCEAADWMALSATPSPPVTVALLNAMSDPSDDVRWRVVRAVMQLGLDGPKTLLGLREALSDSSASVRYQAARALAKADDDSDETLAALAGRLSDDDGRVVRAAIESLQDLDAVTTFLLPQATAVLAHEDQAVAMLAVEALVDMPGPKVVDAIAAAAKERDSAFWAAFAAEQLGPAAATAQPWLLSHIRDSSVSSMLRLQCAIAMTAIGDLSSDAKGVFAEILADASESNSLRSASAIALALHSSGEFEAQFESGMASDDEVLAMVCAWGLSAIQPDDELMRQQAIERLAAGLENDQPPIRAIAARALKELSVQPRVLAPYLVASMNDDDPMVMANVVDALSSLGDVVVEPTMEALDIPEIRNVAIAVLSRVGPDASAAVSSLVKIYDVSKAEQASQIHLALAAIGSPTAESLDLLQRSLVLDDERLRHTAIYAIGKIGSAASAARAALIAHLDYPTAFDRGAAAWALAHIAADDDSIRQLVLPILLDGLDSDEVLIRMESCNALALVGESSSAASDRLREISLLDPDSTVRDAAQAAMDVLSKSR
ncbi:MAG: HEAT repeat domain-containing protein [Planctomycetota bacterium]